MGVEPRQQPFYIMCEAIPTSYEQQCFGCFWQNLYISGSPEDMWTPYKHLHSVIEKSVVHSTKSSLSQLEVVLRKHKQNFSTILRNPVIITIYLSMRNDLWEY